MQFYDNAVYRPLIQCGRDPPGLRWCLICIVGTMSIIGLAVKRHLVVAIIAIAGGFSGSVLHDLISAKSTTVRAERFEVVGRSGRVLSYWGPDADRNIPPLLREGPSSSFLIHTMSGDCNSVPSPAITHRT